MKKLTLFLLLVLVVAFGIFSSLATQPEPQLLNELHKVMPRYRGRFTRADVAVLIDYSQPLFRRRLWVMDLKTGAILLNAHVSHSMKSGLIIPSDFSNDTKSYKSCRGAFATGKAYEGRRGYCMQLNGLDKDVNDNASKRTIIFEGKYLPWSFGAFITIPPVSKKLIDMTHGGAFVWVHAKEK